jgi:hypothetical protein
MSALAAPGYFWEFGMEMEGMPFAMPKQKVCAPKDSKEPPISRDDDECKMMEKKMTGNRFYWKAQCKDGLMVGDITSTPTSYHGTMKMTEKSGNTMSMKISGKRLGDCDYKDRSGEILALQKQSESQMANLCQTGLESMQGQLLSNGCPKEKAIFCQRLATPEGYDKATRNIPFEMINDPAVGMQASARMCKLDNAKLLPKLCASAVSDSNFNFVSRLCPAERPKLCANAAKAVSLGYVAAHCPAEKAVLLKENCEGRRYSSEIEPRFANFCAGAAMNGEMASAASGFDAQSAAAPAAEVEKSEKLQQGIKQLRGLFGF